MKREESTQLGLDYGTATNQLKRFLFWDLLKKTNQTLCFRCNNPMAIDDFSVDHKEQWLHNSIDLFWNLENIAYSHKHCNREHRKSRTAHGSITMYKYKGCRCILCRETNARYERLRNNK